MRAHGQNASEDGTHNILIWRPRHHQVRKLRPHLKGRFVPHRPQPVDTVEMSEPVDGVELREQLLPAVDRLVRLLLREKVREAFRGVDESGVRVSEGQAS